MTFEGVVHGGQASFGARVETRGMFEYAKHQVTPKWQGPLQVAFMEIPAGKSAYPFHWHESVAEVYVILAGRGLVRSSAGEFEVGPGDVAYFPAGASGAHRMTNIGDEPLRYVDVDSVTNPDICHYPDSGKTGVFTDLGATMWRSADAVSYYEGEADAGPSPSAVVTE